LIEVLNLHKIFHDRKKGEIPAVRGVSFTCSPGRVFGLLSFLFDQPRELEGREIEFCSLAVLQCASAVARALSLAEPPAER